MDGETLIETLVQLARSGVNLDDTRITLDALDLYRRALLMDAALHLASVPADVHDEVYDLLGGLVGMLPPSE